MNPKAAWNFETFFDSTDPLTARHRFISRPLVNMAVIAGLFVLAVGFISLVVVVAFHGSVMLMLAGDGAALFGAYGLYILWDKRPIRVSCPECTKVILGNKPWVCAVCKKANLNTVEFPFVNKCEYCGTEPNAYRCDDPKCKHLIFLSDDPDPTNYAYRLNSPDDVSKEDERARILSEHHESREDQEHKIAMAKGDVTLAALEGKYKFLKDQSKTKEKKPPLEAKREHLKGFFDSKNAAAQVAREQKEINAKECANDPAERKRRDRIVDFWLQREISGENEETE